MDQQWAEEFGPNHAGMRFVQNALTGEEERGYSQALLGVDGEWRGMEIRALPAEEAVIDTVGCNSVNIVSRYSTIQRPDHRISDTTASNSYSRQYEYEPESDGSMMDRLPSSGSDGDRMGE
jgi:hypothetical protein